MRAGRAPAIRVGVGLAALYVLVALGTGRMSGRPVLPLFDGFAPPAPYSWVNPPPERAGDNVVPKPVERELALAPDGVPASNVSTDDAQALVGLDKASVPASPPDTGVAVRLVPVDAATLGSLPPGLRAVSNAYKIELAYVPSQTTITRLAAKGTVALTAADAGDRLLFSADGRTWQETQFRPYGQDHGLFTELETVGWFVVATSAADPPAASGDARPLRTVLLVIAGLVPIVGAVLVVRLPSPVPEAAPSRPGRSKSPARPSGKKRPKRRR